MTVRPDRDMQEALDEDLAALRRKNPKAAAADVIRAWSRVSNRTRLVKNLLQWQERAKALASHAKAATDQAEALRRAMAAYEAKELEGRSKAIAAALRVLRAPQNQSLRDLLGQLVREEANGKPAETPNYVLSRARRELGSWKTLQTTVGEP